MCPSGLSQISSTGVIFLFIVLPICQAQQKAIFDTNFGSDVDDIAALGMLHALADRCEIELLAVMHNAPEDKGVAAIDAVNTYYGRPNIPGGQSLPIISVGHLTNLDRLLKDKAGRELIQTKVAELVIMGGNFSRPISDYNLL